MGTPYEKIDAVMYERLSRNPFLMPRVEKILTKAELRIEDLGMAPIVARRLRDHINDLSKWELTSIIELVKMRARIRQELFPEPVLRNRYE